MNFMMKVSSELISVINAASWEAARCSPVIGIKTKLNHPKGRSLLEIPGRRVQVLWRVYL